jgi:uncharacterized membrane protein YjdF
MLLDVIAISRAVWFHRPIPFIERMLAYWLSYQRFGVATMAFQNLLLPSSQLVDLDIDAGGENEQHRCRRRE